MEFQKWFETFLEEKELESKSWEIEHNGSLHMIDSSVVIEGIMNTSKREQEKIKHTLVKIDFINGDVNHYFRFLAEAMIKQQYQGVA